MRPKSADKEKAIRDIALQMIAEEGLENLTMQKLAAAANISPRTIYIKYENKDDLLIKLFIKEVLGEYEAAVLKDFDADMPFADGITKLWRNTFLYYSNNRHAFVLSQYGRTSPLLNRAFQRENIKEGQYFAPVRAFLRRHAEEGAIRDLPHDVLRAMLFAPLTGLITEYFDHLDRPQQIITSKVLDECCEAVIISMQNNIS